MRYLCVGCKRTFTRYPQDVDRNGRSVRLRALMPLMWAGVCDTNNVMERVISRRKIRYKTLRGYKSMEGMMNCGCRSESGASPARHERAVGRVGLDDAR